MKSALISKEYVTIKNEFLSKTKITTSNQLNAEPFMNEQQQTNFAHPDLLIQSIVLEDQLSQSSNSEIHEDISVIHLNNSADHSYFQMITKIQTKFKIMISNERSFMKSEMQTKDRKLILNWLKKTIKILRNLQSRLSFATKQVNAVDLSSKETSKLTENQALNKHTFSY